MSEFIALEPLAQAVETDADHDWGYELRLVNTPLYCGKFLVYTNNAYPGSLHYHEKKTETFKVLDGKLTIVREYRAGDLRPVGAAVQESHGRVYLMQEFEPGGEIIVPAGYRHQVRAESSTAVILEVSTHHQDSDTYRDGYTILHPRESGPISELSCLPQGSGYLHGDSRE